LPTTIDIQEDIDKLEKEFADLDEILRAEKTSLQGSQKIKSGGLAPGSGAMRSMSWQKKFKL